LPTTYTCTHTRTTTKNIGNNNHNNSNNNNDDDRYRQHRDHLNDLLDSAGCEQAQAVKIRKFFRLSYCRLQHDRDAAVLSRVSQRQHGAFVQSHTCAVLSGLSVFREPDPAEGATVRDRHLLFVHAVSEKLVARMFPALEQLVCQGARTFEPTCYMYIIRRGLVGSRGRVFRAGDVLGEDIVCTNLERQYVVSVRHEFFLFSSFSFFSV
jgi:hypothetical protein